MTITLSGLNRFPVKSCRGEALHEAVVEPWGLQGDRRWMLVDDGGETVTAREVPNLLLVEPALTPGGLRLRYPGLDDLHVPVPTGPPLHVSIFGRAPFPATLADESAHPWFGKVTGTSVRLVHLGDPTVRRTNPAFSRPDDCAAFHDGYPVSLAGESSLALLNDWIADGPLAGEQPLPMIRFRPNLVVRGAEPFAEDGWRRIRIGDAAFRVVKGTDRCVITTTDPDTAARGKEPIATLSRRRRWDGVVWFAMSLIPDTPGASLQVGGEVEVLEAVAAPDGPPR